MKSTTTIILFLMLTFQVAVCVGQEPSVIISEIMYDTPINENPNYNPAYSLGEYVEVYNCSRIPVDISGWSITSGDETIQPPMQAPFVFGGGTFYFPSGTLLGANEAIIVAFCPQQMGFFSFIAFYNGTGLPSDPKLIFQDNFVLPNIGSEVILKDSKGVVKDNIYYNGNGYCMNQTMITGGQIYLCAQNPDNTPGFLCKSLQRTTVQFLPTGSSIQNPNEWISDIVTPGNVSSYFKNPISETIKYIYSYDSTGNRIKRKLSIEQMVQQAMSAAFDTQFSESLLTASAEESKLQLEIYPNPTEGSALVKFKDYTAESKKGTILVTTIHGFVVFQREINSNDMQINLAGQMPGIYLVEIRVDNKVFTGKIIKV